MNGKPILCLDFDGVCHSYVSGWTGADQIKDPPVEGLFEFLEEADKHFAIHIFSSRSHQEGGIEAMKAWFYEWFSRQFGRESIPPFELHFPTVKPPAKVTIDDRGILFMGIWPSVDGLRRFEPWNKKEI